MNILSLERIWTKFCLNVISIILGVSGPVFIDGNGDRALSLQMKNFHGGKMHRVANYFRHSEKLEFTDSKMYWPGRTVNTPKGRPDCGFDNEFCVSPGVNMSFILVKGRYIFSVYNFHFVSFEWDEFSRPEILNSLRLGYGKNSISYAALYI